MNVWEDTLALLGGSQRKKIAKDYVQGPVPLQTLKEDRGRVTPRDSPCQY